MQLRLKRLERGSDVIANRLGPAEQAHRALRLAARGRVGGKALETATDGGFEAKGAGELDALPQVTGGVVEAVIQVEGGEAEVHQGDRHPLAVTELGLEPQTALG